jgi:chemotaxis protein CheX
VNVEIPTEIVSHLVTATREVFETMILKQLTEEPPLTREEKLKSHVVATVAFAGYRRGAVSFHSSLPTAKVIAGAMLGQPAETINGEMPDAIGEIGNMIAGTFRTRLAAVEPASAIAVPSVTVGSDFSTRYPVEARRAVVPFKLEGDSVYVELILTGD